MNKNKKKIQKNRPLNTDYVCYLTWKNKTPWQKRSPREEGEQRSLFLFHFSWQWHIETILAGMRLSHFSHVCSSLYGPTCAGGLSARSLSSTGEKQRGVAEASEIIPKYKQKLWKNHPATSVPVCRSASQTFFRNFSLTRRLAWKFISLSVLSS